MKSVCIKTNSSDFLEYLQRELHNFSLESVCFSRNTFKSYDNIIVHYTGDNESLFIQAISQILSYLVLDEIEEVLLQRIIIRNYFYFDAIERNQILNLCFKVCSEDFTEYFDRKFKFLSQYFDDFLQENDTLVLSGFIQFRLPEYIKILEEIVDYSVNSFIIEREYLEFISLLKLYISSQKAQMDTVHLVYFEEEQFLLDENKAVIPLSERNYERKIFI